MVTKYKKAPLLCTALVGFLRVSPIEEEFTCPVLEKILWVTRAIRDERLETICHTEAFLVKRYDSNSGKIEIWKGLKKTLKDPFILLNKKDKESKNHWL